MPVTAVPTAVPLPVTAVQLHDHADADLQGLRTFMVRFSYVLRPFGTPEAMTDSTYMDAVPFMTKILRESASDIHGTSVSSLLSVLLPTDQSVTVAHVRALLETL